jgi:hypothetical protein
MVARNFKDFKKQLLFLLFVFASPVLILYAQTPMPQALLITLSYFFLFFLFHATQKNDDFFLYSAGVTIFLSFFYHQAGIIIFLVWLFAVIFTKRTFIFSNKKVLFSIIFIATFGMLYFEKMWQFLSSWVLRIIPQFFASNNLNLFYPAYYINTDRKLMGWGSMSGVLKFYAFHMGPLLGIILALSLGLLISNKNFRSFFAEKMRKNIAIFIISMTFLLFFTIAEIFPRFPNISLLPDRAWVFCGIFAFVFLYVILLFVKKIPNWIMGVFILLLLVDISGAMYINYLKKYLITPAQLESAKWIENELPQNRIFLSSGHKNLLPVHANTPLARIPLNYCSKDIQDFEIPKKTELAIIYPPSYSSALISSISKEKTLYIYYSRQHPKNPYYDRPYEMSTWGAKPCPDGKFLFDLYPDKFKRVYSTGDEEVIIWELLRNTN